MFAPSRMWSSTRRAALVAGVALAGPVSVPSIASAELMQAASAARVADHAVVGRARTLSRCQRRGASCATSRSGLQLAARRSAVAVRTLRGPARRAGAPTPVAGKAPSTLTVSGSKLSWRPVAGVTSYVLTRKVPRQATTYSVVRGTSAVPPALPGKTVRYAVRTAVRGSRWSAERSISYSAPGVAAAQPAAEPTSAPADTGAPADVKRTDAPVVTIDARSIRWTAVAGVTDYVLLRKAPGAADSYSAVHGTSVTPSASPGKTVSYSVRTAVDGSAWATEAAVTYPSESASSAPSAAPSSSAFSVGMVAGSAATWELPFLTKLGARTARLEYDIDTPAAELATDVENYAKAGIRPLLLAGFQGRVPTHEEALKLGAWAAAYGPDGSFWSGKSYPASVAPTQIEFGNETSFSSQYSQLAGNEDWANTSFYKGLAAEYGRGVKAAAQAVRAANPKVGLLAVGDQPGGWGTWMAGMFAAVPELGSYVSGWTVHPYGPNWQKRIDDTLANANRQGAPDSIPVWMTEFGVSSDSGRCLSDNYGFDKCMTAAAAASTLTDAVSAMRARYGSRLASVYLYQAHDQRTAGSTTDREAYFGALTLKGDSKGVMTDAVKSILAS